MDICLYLDDVITPWRPTKRADFAAQCFWILGYSRSLEGLIYNEAFLVQMLWQNDRILIRKIPVQPLWTYCLCCVIFGHTFRTRNAGKSTKGSKNLCYSLFSNEVLSHEIGCLGR